MYGRGAGDFPPREDDARKTLDSGEMGGGDIEPHPKKEIEYEDILSRMFFGQVILVIYI